MTAFRNGFSECRKGIIFVGLLLTSVVALSACNDDNMFQRDSEPTTNISQDENITSNNNILNHPTSENAGSNKEMAAYQEVLLGTKNYKDAQSKEFLSINQLYYINEIVPAEPRQFIIQDLDGDGVPEVVIQMDMNNIKDFGSLVLHYENEQVVGYYLWRRAFSDLKIDGTFLSSGGAFDYGFSIIDFSAFDPKNDEGSHTIVKHICYCTSSAGFNEDGIAQEKYYCNGTEISAEEFVLELEKWFTKEDVSWIEFTNNNIGYQFNNFLQDNF